MSLKNYISNNYLSFCFLFYIFAVKQLQRYQKSLTSWVRHRLEHKDLANRLPPLRNYETQITLCIYYRRKRVKSMLFIYIVYFGGLLCISALPAASIHLIFIYRQYIKMFTNNSRTIDRSF